MFTTAYVKGIGLCSGLIMAIGAQNAHVLRTGIKREHVGLTVLTCTVIDIALICLGVAGVGSLVQASPMLLGLARWGGAAFLLVYGLRSWRAVFAGATLEVGAVRSTVSTGRALLAALAISLLNPHVYLDTVVLIGAIGGNFPPAERPSFALGAMTVSIVWFSALGYGAGALSRWFARPAAWKCIDALAGTTMLVLSASVAMGN